MKQLILAERFSLAGHIVAMAFGLAGLLLVLPHPEFVLTLSATGQVFFQWAMAGGGVFYIILGTIAVSIYAYRTLGRGYWLAFMVPSVLLSLSSELLGTSTGFPFGHYGYLSGLGYKIAGLVPFTIPLSWFYLGFVSYLIARAGLEPTQASGESQKTDHPIWSQWLRQIAAVGLGALLLTSWDFVLDPAMSQTAFPFWHWEQPGAFFGMPYQNFAGWMGTGALFMSVAGYLWSKIPQTSRPVKSVPANHVRLIFPLVVYLSNFAFAAIMSLAAGIWIPVLLGLLLGVAPALLLWWRAQTQPTLFAPVSAAGEVTTFVSETTTENVVSVAPNRSTASIQVSSKL